VKCGGRRGVRQWSINDLGDALKFGDVYQSRIMLTLQSKYQFNCRHRTDDMWLCATKPICAPYPIPQNVASANLPRKFIPKKIFPHSIIGGTSGATGAQPMAARCFELLHFLRSKFRSC
jgi:hypothetical protein